MVGLICLLSIAHAQSSADTFKISLAEAEKIFLQKNLTLLAAKYNIDAGKALVTQAKLWDNPTLVTDQNVYDGAFFRHTKDNGQVYVQVQQLIRTAGKIKKQTQLAQDNTMLAQDQFDDLMRNLQYTLRSDFIETWHLLKIKKVYDMEIAEVKNLVKGMDEVYKTGNISQKDYMRLKATLFSLQNELVNIQLQLIPVQSEIRLLLQSSDNVFVLPVMNYQLPELINAVLPSADSLFSTAINNRPDAKIAKTTLDFQKHNLSYQKALSKPDVTVGPEYDRLNSYQPNYVGLSISLPLNIFNRNQGNIKAAQIVVQQQKTQVEFQIAKIRNEITNALNKATYFQSINNKEQLDFSKSYDNLFQNMLSSYQSRQISLLDFTDFIDSYKDNKLKLVEQHINLVKALAELNYTTNSNVITIQ
jgi:outer membrane protein, heavy metal efflux system